MKIYTKTGDDGTTSLFGGGRVSKSSPRIECYGTVDELNSWLGVVLTQECSSEALGYLTRIQNTLFVLGSDLATPTTAKVDIQRIEESHSVELETWIDQLDAGLEPLTSFILPGGTPAAASLHVARTICRRAERLCVQIFQTEQISDAVIHYLNRLSDFLFMLARWENHVAGVKDTPWISR
jgi:cob(I)alamin adenosyltransferase